MSFSNGLTTADVLDAFSEQLQSQSGTVADSYNDGSRLFARGILPRGDVAQPGDKLQAGVAIRAGLNEVCLHPYVYRLVCQNGAIMAQAIQSRVIGNFYELPSYQAIEILREAVDICCDATAFDTAVSDIRTTLDRQADSFINLLPMLSRMSSVMQGEFLHQIMQRYFEEGDRTQFGLMNAVTSVARDTADPEARWNLELLGGGIPVLAAPSGPRPHLSARRRARKQQSPVEIS
jgi:hypothetical protein